MINWFLGELPATFSLFLPEAEYISPFATENSFKKIVIPSKKEFNLPLGFLSLTDPEFNWEKF